MLNNLIQPYASTENISKKSSPRNKVTQNIDEVLSLQRQQRHKYGIDKSP